MRTRLQSVGLLWLIAASLPLSGDVFDQYQTWESRDGRQLEAKVLEIDPQEETVHMQRRSGARFTIGWQRFSKADRNRIAAAAKREAAQNAKASETDRPTDSEDPTLSTEQALPNTFELKDVPMVTQKGAFCVPASATMVAGYHGIETDQDEVARLSSEMSASNQGTNPADMLLAMNKLGFGGRSLYWKTESEFLESALPIIRRELVQTGPIYISFKPGVFGLMGHGCVIVGYDDRREELHFHNPWGNTFEKDYEVVAVEGYGIVLITPPLAAPIASPEFVKNIQTAVPLFDGDFLQLASRIAQTKQAHKLVWCSRRDARSDRRFARDTARDDGRKILELAFERNPAVLIPHSEDGKTEKYYFVTRPPEGGARFLVRAIDSTGWQEAELYTLGSLTRNWATEIEVGGNGEKIWELPMIELHP